MKTLEAIQRMAWRISEGKTFKPNQNDAEAVNKIIDFYTKTNEKSVTSNIQFAKLYLWTFWYNLRFYQDITISQKEINKQLDVDIFSIYEEIVKELNNLEVADLLNDELKDTWNTVGKDVQEILQMRESNNNTKVDKDLIIEASKTWDFETVKANCNAMITEALNHFKTN
jgi:hypothetical protein